jgi:hypothetical protein
VLKIKRGDIAVCKVAILDKFQKRYQALFDSGRGQIDSKKRFSKCMYESVGLQQESAVGNLLKKRGVVVSGSALSPLSESSFSSALAGMSTSTSVRGSKQNSFAFSSQRTMSTMNLDIQKSNNATIEMAIADFFHCKITHVQLLSCQDLYGLYACATLLERILLCPIESRLRVSYLTSIMQMSMSKTRPTSSSLPRYLD